MRGGGGAAPIVHVNEHKKTGVRNAQARSKAKSINLWCNHTENFEIRTELTIRRQKY
jgi:hypothetical protein